MNEKTQGLEARQSPFPITDQIERGEFDKDTAQALIAQYAREQVGFAEKWETHRLEYFQLMEHDFRLQVSEAASQRDSWKSSAQSMQASIEALQAENSPFPEGDSPERRMALAQEYHSKSLAWNEMLNALVNKLGLKPYCQLQGIQLDDGMDKWRKAITEKTVSEPA